MTCCQCQGIESLFNKRVARRELKKYQRKGPRKTTQRLLAALRQLGVQDMTLLDIGGGVGVIQHEMLKAGVRATTHIDASSAYLRAARGEGERRGNGGKMSFRHADFMDCAAETVPHDLVTLDRVICCYDDMTGLVAASARLVRRYYAVVYPYDGWFSKLAFGAANAFLWLTRRQFRGFVYATRDVERVLSENSLERVFFGKGILWQVAVYQRRAD
jgi:magnesium-protoporphyrin O-methyltransferase